MIFDGHSDIWSDVTIRSLKGESNILTNYHLERLKQGNIEGSIFVVWVDPPYTDRPVKRVEEIFKAVEKELEECQQVKLVKNSGDIVETIKENKFYIIMGMEGLSGISPSLDEIDKVYEKGVRHISLTWNEENEFGTGIQGGSDRGLTAIGKEAVKKILSKNIILDVSHLNDNSFWDLVKIADAPIVASHSNARALCSAKRNLTDEQLKAIKDLDGLVGMNSFNMFVSNNVERQNLDKFVEHIAYVAEKIGVEHVGFGFDFFEFLPKNATQTYSFQESSFTKGLEDCSKVPLLIDKMRNMGFSEKEIELISRENWMRIIKNRLG